MKTKLTLTIAGKENELASDCLMNWDEVQCTCKRADFSGVVRSFSSKFEFTNAAYDMLMSAYLNDGVRADVVVAIYVLNNDWSWSKEFEAPLNFSTASWDGYVFSVNCIDNGLAALIKARKSTKYEFTIGDDIFPNQSLTYDRIKMLNTVTYGIVGHGTAEGGATIINHATSFQRLPTYIVNDDETYAGSPIVSHDENEDSGSCFISLSQSVAELDIKTDITFNGAYNIEIHLFEFDSSNPDFNESYVDKGIVFKYSQQEARQRTFLGKFSDLESLKKAYPIPPANSWAGVGEPPLDSLIISDYVTPYFAPVVDDAEDNEWIAGSNGFYFSEPNWEVKFDCPTQRFIKHFKLKNLSAGKKYALFYMTFVSDNVIDKTTYATVKSTIKAQWLGRANEITIDAISPENLLKSILSKISDDRFCIDTQISEYDQRLGKTYLVCAESIRGIKGAKIYTTFNDFCDWLETVFGYVYTLGEPIPAQYNGIMPISGIEDDWSGIHGTVVEGYCPNGRYGEDPFFIRSHNCFCVCDNHVTGNMYTQWKESYKYNGENGKARKDLIFDDGMKYYVLDEIDDLVEFLGDAKSASKIAQQINFVHRSELFQNENQEIVFYDANELHCKVNNSMLYSVVEVGYKKQDYETQCGRDEWNFMNYYNTGIDVIEKKLTLQSAYRADCYGFEFLAQKRNQDTTDNESDSRIFFVYCNEVEDVIENQDGSGSRGDATDSIIGVSTHLVLSRSCKIQGALSDTVFNGEFSPYYCVKANEGYISAMAPNVTLQFASSDGNSDIVIDGVKTTADIALGERLFSEMELDFTATDLERTIDYSKLVKVVKNGLVYSGFFKQTENCYARPSEVDYTLIVKSIEPI
ncbi:MAG: hypothetical protein NC421_07580 [Lachnospiraceae bacterium]|nr:hypothetical protein [Lachnospiraceae bacterium]